MCHLVSEILDVLIKANTGPFFYRGRNGKNILVLRRVVKGIVENHILQVTVYARKLNFAPNHICPTSISQLNSLRSKRFRGFQSKLDVLASPKMGREQKMREGGGGEERNLSSSFCYCAYVLHISGYPGFLRNLPPNTTIFCAVYDYVEKADLSKG